MLTGLNSVGSSTAIRVAGLMTCQILPEASILAGIRSVGLDWIVKICIPSVLRNWPFCRVAGVVSRLCKVGFAILGDTAKITSTIDFVLFDLLLNVLCKQQRSCQGGCEQRSEAFVKIQKKNNNFFWGGGEGWVPKF